MNISSITFIGIYFPILLILYYNPLIKGVKYQNMILLLASIGFYAMVAPFGILFLAASVLFHYGMVHLEAGLCQKRWGNLAMILDVAILLGYKYLAKVFGLLGWEAGWFSSVAVPVGLSYFTFREISYLMECRKDRELAKAGLLEVALFIGNFLCITSGPLGFFDTEVMQYQERHFDKNLFYSGINRFATGLVKKVIIGDNLHNLPQFCYSNTGLSMVMAWAGAIGYLLELYFDFSGYTDMAIGMGQVFGLRLEENFNLPYTAKSVSDYWKRWHMSLTKWFTRYVYIPLGGSRVSSASRHIFNLWVVWLCTGIWHGSGGAFIVWAMIFFLFQTLEKYTGITKLLNRWHLGNVYAMLVVVFAYVFFRADSISSAGNYIFTMLGGHFAGFASIKDWYRLSFYLIPGVLGILWSSGLSVRFNRFCERVVILQILQRVVLLGAFILSILLMMSRGYTAPLYAGF